MSSEAAGRDPAAPNYHDVVWTPERVARLWGYYGDSPAHAATYFSKLYGGDILRTVSAQGVPLDGATIVDFGCGPGHLLEHLFASHQPRAVWGVEFSKPSAERATERLRGNPSFKAVVDATSLPVDLPDACCDVLFLVEVVEHLDDETLKGTVMEARRLLKPGGYLVVTTPNGENLEGSKTACPECGCVFHFWQHVRSWTPQSLRAYLEQAGMTTLTSMGTWWKQRESRSPLAKLRSLRAWIRTQLHGPSGPFLLYVGRR